MERQERELLEGYRKLRPESQRFIMATVIGAISAETGAEATIKRQYGLPPEGNPVQATPQGK